MIEGELIRLRAIEPADAERAHAWINDREVTRFILGGRYPVSLADEQAWATEAARGNAFQDSRLAIETKDGVHIGNCGLHRAVPEDRSAELGIMIGDKDYWSKGYGTDTVRTLCRFGFQQMNLHRIALGVLEFNDRGIACYKKCGFVEEGRFRQNFYIDGRYWDTIRMSVLREEFEALHPA